MTTNELLVWAISLTVAKGPVPILVWLESLKEDFGQLLPQPRHCPPRQQPRRLCSLLVNLLRKKVEETSRGGDVEAVVKKSKTNLIKQYYPALASYA